MRKIKGFTAIRSLRKEAAAHVAAESRRSKLATDAAIDARLQELARSRG
jgi:hypothetical protein